MKFVVVMCTLVLIVSCGKQQVYRSENGCCVCGVKSQRGNRFLSSENYEIEETFGLENCHGDICRACISAVSRWRKKGHKYYEVTKIYNIPYNMNDICNTNNIYNINNIHNAGNNIICTLCLQTSHIGDCNTIFQKIKKQH